MPSTLPPGKNPADLSARWTAAIDIGLLASGVCDARTSLSPASAISRNGTRVICSTSFTYASRSVCGTPSSNDPISITEDSCSTNSTHKPARLFASPLDVCRRISTTPRSCTRLDVRVGLPTVFSAGFGGEVRVERADATTRTFLSERLQERLEIEPLLLGQMDLEPQVVEVDHL